MEDPNKPKFRNPNAHVSIRGILTAGTPPPLRANRNDKCPCGSNKKYKKCCLGPDQNWGHDDDGKLLPARVLAYEAEKRLTQDRVRQTLGDYTKGVAIK